MPRSVSESECKRIIHILHLLHAFFQRVTGAEYGSMILHHTLHGAAQFGGAAAAFRVADSIKTLNAFRWRVEAQLSRTHPVLR